MRRSSLHGPPSAALSIRPPADGSESGMSIDPNGHFRGAMMLVRPLAVVADPRAAEPDSRPIDVPRDRSPIETVVWRLFAPVDIALATGRTGRSTRYDPSAGPSHRGEARPTGISGRRDSGARPGVAERSPHARPHRSNDRPDHPAPEHLAGRLDTSAHGAAPQPGHERCVAPPGATLGIVTVGSSSLHFSFMTPASSGGVPAVDGRLDGPAA